MKKCCEGNIELEVCENNFGFYFGKLCTSCGVYHKESIYYKERNTAEKELELYKQYCKIMNANEHSRIGEKYNDI